MKFKLFVSLDSQLLDAEEYHLDNFPNIGDFIALDNPTLKRVRFTALHDRLPLVMHNLKVKGEFVIDRYVKWAMTEDDLFDLGKPVYFAVRTY